jgi:hypothetical protein
MKYTILFLLPFLAFFTKEPVYEGSNFDFVILKGERDVYPSAPVPVFLAEINERRNAETVTGNPEFVGGYNKIKINNMSSFEPSSGTFTAPSTGYYHLYGAFEIENYACRTQRDIDFPVMFNVQLVLNNTVIIGDYRFPVRYIRAGMANLALQREFNLLQKLNAGETVRLKVGSKKCEPAKGAYYQRVIFSGLKAG